MIASPCKNCPERNQPKERCIKHSDFEIYQKKGGPHGTAGHQL